MISIFSSQRESGFESCEVFIENVVTSQTYAFIY